MQRRWMIGYLLLGSALFVGAPALASILSSADDDSTVVMTKVARAEGSDVLRAYQSSTPGILPALGALILLMLYSALAPMPALAALIAALPALKDRAPPAAVRARLSI
jgi:hypothetical protein